MVERFLGKVQIWLHTNEVISTRIVNWIEVEPANVVFLIDEQGFHYNLRYIAKIKKVEP